MGAGMGGWGAAAYAAAPATAIQVTVPNESVGKIIGKAGSSINEIRQSSGAKIDVAQAQPGDVMRTITIKGTPEQNQMAQYLISLKMMEGQMAGSQNQMYAQQTAQGGWGGAANNGYQ
jgi:predicted PilT family ATPase